MGASDRQPCEFERGAPRRGLGVDDRLGARQEIVPGRRRVVRQVGLAGYSGVPRRSDDVQQERPAIELAIDRALRANRWNDVVDHVLRDVIVPRLDHAGLDERRHFDERRLPDIDVPSALFVLGLGNEAFDAETLDRGNLIVDSGKLLVHVHDAGMKVLDPLIERGRERAVRRKRRLDSRLRNRSDAGESEAGDQAAGHEFAPVDAPLREVAARFLLDEIFSFVTSTHFSTSQWFSVFWRLERSHDLFTGLPPMFGNPPERQCVRNRRARICIGRNRERPASTGCRLTLSANMKAPQ